MISLNYLPPSSLWQHFEFKSTLTTAVCVSLLTTIISYQLTALVTDVFLGCKSRHVARIHTFHALLLSRQSSPFAIFNALLRSDLLTRLYFRHYLSTKAGALPNDRAIPRDKARVKASSVCLLLVLLVSPPITNMCLVGITVESKGG